MVAAHLWGLFPREENVGVTRHPGNMHGGLKGSISSEVPRQRKRASRRQDCGTRPTSGSLRDGCGTSHWKREKFHTLYIHSYTTYIHSPKPHDRIDCGSFIGTPKRLERTDDSMAGRTQGRTDKTATPTVPVPTWLSVKNAVRRLHTRSPEPAAQSAGPHHALAVLYVDVLFEPVRCAACGDFPAVGEAGSLGAAVSVALLLLAPAAGRCLCGRGW